MNSSGELLSLNKISARYTSGSFGDRNVLEEISFTLPNVPGLVALIGPNGSGKTTLLRVITGQLSPRQGVILLSGIDVTTEPPHRHYGLSCLFQRAIDGMCATLTVEENLSLMLMQGGPSLFRPLVTSLRRTRLLERAQQIMTSTGANSTLMSNLKDALRRYPNEFSGGELQQLCLLALLLQEPPALLVLADEPTLNLDRVNRQTCIDMLVTLSRATTVLVATHDKDLIDRNNRTLTVEQGRLAGCSDQTTGIREG